MSNVTLRIGGRTFSVACADGEEEHIAELGRMIDGKLEALGDNSGRNEVRMLLYAALVLADELHEAQKAAPAAQHVQGIEQRFSDYLDGISGRLENIAARLEG